jgi:hypothetical protein
MILNKIGRFYYEGFTNMSRDSRRLWVIILVKLFFMFAVLKIFFFPDILKKNFKNDTERIQYMERQLIDKK